MYTSSLVESKMNEKMKGWGILSVLSITPLIFFLSSCSRPVSEREKLSEEEIAKTVALQTEKILEEKGKRIEELVRKLSEVEKETAN